MLNTKQKCNIKFYNDKNNVNKNNKFNNNNIK